MVSNDYSAGEIAWLLALSRDEAIEEDRPKASSFAPMGSAGGGSGSRLPTLVRWADVRIARDRLHGQYKERDLWLTELVTQGYTQAEAAAILGVSQQTASRSFRATIESIQAELDGLGAPGAARS